MQYRHVNTTRFLWILLILLACHSVSTTDAWALSAKAYYFQAENCYNSLKRSATKQKYRDNWLRCIRKFDQVYRTNPSGPWAAAGLYNSGKLYTELYRFSGRQADLNEAQDLFRRIVRRFPGSRYHSKAKNALQQIAIQKKSDTAKANPKPIKRVPDKAPAPKVLNDFQKRYQTAYRCYEEILESPTKRKYRSFWMECINQFKAIHSAQPKGSHAASALYMQARLYDEMHVVSLKETDRQTANQVYRQVVNQYGDTFFARKARQRLGENGAPSPLEALSTKVPENNGSGTVIRQPYSDPKSRPKSDQLAKITNMRYWSNPNYTRMVIDVDRETTYRHHILKKDPKRKKPQRLYIDFNRTRLADSVKTHVPINDNLLTDARAGQYSAETVRVVIDIKSFKTYKVFSLKNPFRTVIDLWGESPQSLVDKEPKVTGKVPDFSQKPTANDLAKQLSLGVRRIVIDPGHGGKDYGAPGYLKGVHEKQITLQIAKKLAQQIRAQTQCEVILTRSTDTYLTLEERTAMANTRSADLFISIHTNASTNRRAAGLETYFLNLATDDEAVMVAARENATSAKNISDLETILQDLMQNTKINESSRLAGYVQTSMYRWLKGRKYSHVRSKGVKQAPFYVLMGADMPSILVETSFISNPRECKRLTNPKYQDHLCQGIVNGIKKYIKEITPTAIFRPNQTRKS